MMIDSCIICIKPARAWNVFNLGALLLCEGCRERFDRECVHWPEAVAYREAQIKVEAKKIVYANHKALADEGGLIIAMQLVSEAAVALKRKLWSWVDEQRKKDINKMTKNIEDAASND